MTAGNWRSWSIWAPCTACRSWPRAMCTCTCAAAASCRIPSRRSAPGVAVADAGARLYANGERYLRELPRLQRLYPARLLQATLEVAAACHFSLEELRYEYPHELVPPGETASSHLRRLTQAGARWRWPQGVPPAEQTAIEHELALIAELRYEPYFLTVHDIVAFARSRGILCQGRGSAANSRVCYCLGVTSVDPQRGAALLFERFISRERNEPPDIDIDFEHERREEVLQYVYGKYGRERAALAATVIMYRPRSALRDLGKAFGLSVEDSGRLASAMQWWDGSAAMAERLREAGFDPQAAWLQRLLPLAQELVAFPGFPRHLSQHVGGFVISEGLLEELVPVENAAMPERTVVQWDKDDLNDLGLLKVDLLALGMLSALRRAFALVNEFRGTHHALGELPAEDERVYDMVCRADTIGVFQIESRAQMAMLPRLKPRCYYDLVIEVAIVRPGPIQGDMVHPYLQAQERRGSGRVSGRGGARSPASHPRGADLPGAGDADRDRRRRLHRRGSGRTAPGDGRLEEERGTGSLPRAAPPGHARQGLPAGIRTAHLPADARLR